MGRIKVVDLFRRFRPPDIDLPPASVQPRIPEFYGIVVAEVTRTAPLCEPFPFVFTHVLSGGAEMSRLWVPIIAGLFIVLVVESQVHATGPTIQFQTDITVESDGNTAIVNQFPTLDGGNGVRYVLAIENGCKIGKPKCNHPLVGAISIFLNGDEVFQQIEVDDLVHTEVVLNPLGGDDNDIIVEAVGFPGATARIAIAALEPQTARLGGHSVLPAGDLQTVLAIHNAGPNPIGYRIVFYLPDGTVAGESPARRIEPHGADLADLSVLASSIPWTQGPVHVEWGSLADTRVSVSSYQSITIGGQTVPNARALNLDDYGPFPLNRPDFDHRTGGVLN